MRARSCSSAAVRSAPAGGSGPPGRMVMRRWISSCRIGQLPFTKT